MNAKLFILPSLCLGGAALLLAPARPSEAFSKIGGSLGETQRDVRVFDNFLDAGADDNVVANTQFPGWLGLELAIWKAIVEWGSRLHGDGTGDIGGNTLGSGGANFDAMWSGNADGIGTSNGNVASSITSCGGGGTLAYTETPISDGWRIRFCDEWSWSDGPGNIGLAFDIDGVMTHEYGHALGLGHSAVGQATMAPSVGQGSTSGRSIHSDDIAGIQCIYGVASVTKPVITATVGNSGAGTVTIYGSQFGATGNEVWFTNEFVTDDALADPLVKVTGLSSSGGGTIITVTVPAAAGPGDVIVNKSGVGSATVSNAFPTDLVGTFGSPPVPPPTLTNVSPSTIDALIPGTAETITLTGTNLDGVTSVLLNNVPISSSRWTIVNPTTITLDMPQAPSLGFHEMGISNGSVLEEFTVTVVAPATPKLEWGNGDPANIVDQDVGLTMTLAGTPGQRHLVLSSNVGVPSLGRFLGYGSLTFEGKTLIDPGAYLIPAEGWTQVVIGGLPDPALVGASWFAQSYSIVAPRPFADSNDQSITLVP